MDKQLLIDIVRWLPVLCVFGAALVCFIHLQLSRRMWILLAGFLGSGLVGIGNRFVFQLQVRRAHEGQGPADTLGLYSDILFFCGLGAWVVIVAGLALVFADLRDRVDRSPPSSRAETGDRDRPW